MLIGWYFLVKMTVTMTLTLIRICMEMQSLHTYRDCNATEGR